MSGSPLYSPHLPAHYQRMNDWEQLTIWHEPAMIRTDFTQQAAWERLLQVIDAAAKNCPAGITLGLLEDPACQDRSIDSLLASLPPYYQPNFLFLADHTTLQSPDLLVLVVDLYHKRGRTFRTLPSELPDIACNLALCNVDFFELADPIKEGCVYRGSSS